MFCRFFGVGHADEHFCAVNVGPWILKEFVKCLLVPRDVCRFQGGREVVTRYSAALAADNTGERRTELVYAGFHGVTGAACSGEGLFSGRSISGSETRRRADQECCSGAQRSSDNSLCASGDEVSIVHGLTLMVLHTSAGLSQMLA